MGYPERGLCSNGISGQHDTDYVAWKFEIITIQHFEVVVASVGYNLVHERYKNLPLKWQGWNRFDGLKILAHYPTFIALLILRINGKLRYELFI